MKRLKKYSSIGLTVILCLVMAFFPMAPALADVCVDTPEVPPFLSAGVDPNLLLTIDNSASMYDPAYVDVDNQCFDDTFAWDTQYAGYFETWDWYYYDFTNGKFVSWDSGLNAGALDAAFWAIGADEVVYEDWGLIGGWDVSVKIDTVTPAVTGFYASGNFLNWATASKFDIEKEILTGGKYYDPNGGVPNEEVLILESRGCMGRRQIKQVQFNNRIDPGWSFNDISADDLHLTLGIRQPDAAEKAADELATGSTSTTRIEIFNVLEGGFNYDACQAALDDLTADPPKLGDLKQDTKDCMGYSAQVDDMFRDSYSAFNHALQECWYYNKHGDWQPGAGTVNAIMNDCEKMYDHFPDPADITTANKGYLCYGEYGSNPLLGYVGRCWELGTIAGEELVCSVTECDPLTGIDVEFPCLALTSDLVLADLQTITIGTQVIHACDTSWNSGKNECKSGGTHVPIQNPCTGGDLVTTDPGWTDDNADDPDACVDQAIKDYCGIIDIPDVIDPSDATSSTGEVWNAPAVLIDSGVVSQLAEPLYVMKGHMAPRWWETPSGLIQEFQSDIRMGVMTFTDNGSLTECNNLVPNLDPDAVFPYSFEICNPATVSPEGTWEVCDQATVSPVPPGEEMCCFDDAVANKVVCGTVTHDECCFDDRVVDKSVCGVVTVEEQINFNCHVANRDGGMILAYIDQSPAHTDAIVTAVNNLVGLSWTPLAEAIYNAIGYYTQLGPNGNMRINAADFTTHAEDGNIEDPCGAWCHDNNILLITDGSSTADQHPDVVGFAHGDVADSTPDNSDCDVLHGTTYLDDMTYYGRRGTDIFADEPWEEFIDGQWEFRKRPINPYRRDRDPAQHRGRRVQPRRPAAARRHPGRDDPVPGQ